jgi:hypothetical protein
MSGIFVDKNDKFDVIINYVEEGNGIKILEGKKDGCKSLTITFKYPDFETSQEIARASVITTTNEPSIDMFMLRANMIYFLAVAWDAKDKDGKDIDFSIENINRLQPAVIAYLVNQVQLKIGENGVILA